MCLMPFGGNILLPPSVPARKLADYLRIGIALHFALGILIMVAGGYIQGVFQLLGALIGYMAIKNSEGFSIQCVLSYCVFTGFAAFWSLLQIILFFAVGASTEGVTLGWQYYAAIVMIIISPFIHTYNAVTSYYLYKELRRLVDEASGQLGSEEAPQGAGYAPQVDERGAGSSGGATWAHSESHPSAPAGFKAFSGTGNRLGGS